MPQRMSNTTNVKCQIPKKVNQFGIWYWTLDIGHSNQGFTLVEILVSIVIMAVIGVIFYPNIRRFNTNQQFQNEVSDVKNNLKKAQSMYATGTRCSASKSALAWSLVILRNGSFGYNLKATCTNGSTTTTESQVIYTTKSTTLQSSSCSSGATPIELKFDKTGFSYTCDNSIATPVYTSGTFNLQLQNSKNTSQSTTISINQIGSISQN